jgi:hypothetical protein
MDGGGGDLAVFGTMGVWFRKSANCEERVVISKDDVRKHMGVAYGWDGGDWYRLLKNGDKVCGTLVAAVRIPLQTWRVYEASGTWPDKEERHFMENNRIRLCAYYGPPLHGLLDLHSL